MTTATIPALTLPWRMKMALAHAGVSVNEMAEYLGVALPTIRTWTSGKVLPKVGMLRLWAMRTGVDFDWLAEGVQPDSEQRPVAAMLSPGAAPGRSSARSSTDRASDYGSVVLHSRRFRPVQTSQTLVKAA